jgi:hypothetical protein
MRAADRRGDLLRHVVWQLLLAVLLVGMTQARALAQDPAHPVLGEWHGRSTCLVKPSACHDEIVIYSIRRDSVHRDSLTMQADKLVNGARDFMGTLRCGWTAPTLTCPMRGDWWRFTLRADTLVGSLDLADGRRFRDVVVTRAHPK